MKLTLANIKKLKTTSDNKLVKRVCNYIIDNWENYDDKSNIFKDVLNYGCESGVVTDLIYYADTLRFYKQYQGEINDLLYYTMDSLGTTSPKDVFGKKWDLEDPLARDTHNQNLLAWFGFEETMYNIALDIEGEII